MNDVIAVAVTLLLETACVALVARRRDAALLLAVLGANLVTVPIFWMSLAALGGGPAALVALEVAVVLAEWLIYRLVLRLPPARALVASLLANALSFLAGFVLIPVLA